MRYVIGLSGGVIVAVLLLVFQRELIGGEATIDPSPPVVIELPQSKMLKPPQRKDYREPREVPDPPRPLEKPATGDPPNERRVEPPRIPLAGLSGVDGGSGVYLGPSSTFAPLDGGIAPTMMLEPQYPRNALLKGIEGEVEVAFTVLPDGRVGDVEIVRAEPPGVFDQAVRRAVLSWQFLPRRVNGEPVSTRVRQVLEFRLPAQQ